MSTSSRLGRGTVRAGACPGLFGQEAVTVDDGGREINQPAVIGA